MSEKDIQLILEAATFEDLVHAELAGLRISKATREYLANLLLNAHEAQLKVELDSSARRAMISLNTAQSQHHAQLATEKQRLEKRLEMQRTAFLAEVRSVERRLFGTLAFGILLGAVAMFLGCFIAGAWQ